MKTIREPVQTIRELMKLYRTGDKMNDSELLSFNAHMHEVTPLLDELGPEFKLAANETRQIRDMTDAYLKARHEKKEPKEITIKLVSFAELQDLPAFEVSHHHLGYVVRPEYMVVDRTGEEVYGHILTEDGNRHLTYVDEQFNELMSNKDFPMFRLFEREPA